MKQGGSGTRVFDSPKTRLRSLKKKKKKDKNIFLLTIFSPQQKHLVTILALHAHPAG